MRTIVGSFLANITAKLLLYLKIDDAVGATCVHGFGGFWGMMVVGIFGKKAKLCVPSGVRSCVSSSFSKCMPVLDWSE